MTKLSPQPSSLNRLEDGSVEIPLTVPWAEIQTALEKEIQKAVDEAEISGFRKGKAPRNLVEPKLDKSHLYSHAIEHLLPETYSKAVKEAKISPILYPKITLIKGQEGQDWEFKATTCEIPEVNLQFPLKTGKIDELRKEARVKIPNILIEEEANHRLATLAENLSGLGLTTTSYLQTKKLTLETLKSQMSQTARADLETEFILSHIQNEQKLPDRKSTLEFLQKMA